MSNKETTYLFGAKRQSVYYKFDIYDPEIDPPWTPQSSKIIPHPGSIALTLISPKKYKVEIVEKVDPTNYKCTYADIGWVVDPEDEDELTSILSYGNDRWYLYYDDRVKPTKLLIDSKLLILGVENKEYRLVRPDEDGRDEVISLYVDSDETFRGDRIPMTVADRSTPGIKMCTNCHTLSRMYDGDTVSVQVFNILGIQTAEVKLIVKRATLQNDLDSQTNPIVDFDIKAHQMIGDQFYLHQRQDPSHLGLTPYITFADGAIERVPIDNVHCFVYGLEDYQPSFPGQKQRITVKYFLNHRQKSPIVVDDGRMRCLLKDKWITVVPDESTYGVKISTIPLWDSASLSYTLKFFIYTERRDEVVDVTNLVKVSGFDGVSYYEFQNVILDLDLSQIFDNVMAISYRQRVWIKLFPHTDFMKYVLKDSADSEIAYGVESATWKRPAIYYDPDLEQYFVPTSVFPLMEDFVEVFYENSSPLVTSTKTFEPTTPTHFTIRDIDTSRVLITTPIEVSQYAQAWNTILDNPSSLVDKSVMVEFLEYINGAFTIIYGAPVDVHKKSQYFG